MFHHSSKLQYQVRVDKPDPQFAKYLQQAIGGIEGEIRVAMQYFFQAMGARGDDKYRDMLMMTAGECSRWACNADFLRHLGCNRAHRVGQHRGLLLLPLH